MKTSFLLSSKSRMASMIACLSLIIAFASCSKKYEPIPEPVGEAKLRVVHTVFGTAPQDFYVNGIKKSTTGLAYGATSDLITITSGPNTFNINDAGSTTANATSQVPVPIGSKFSLFYFKDTDGKVILASLPDLSSTVPAGKANVRFLNLNSSLNNQLSVSRTGTASPLIPSLAFKVSSDFFPVDPGSTFTFSATGVTPGAAFDGAIVAGKTYTIWIDGSSATVLTGHIFEQN